MTRRTSLIIFALAALILFSCGRRGNKQASKASTTTEAVVSISFFEDGNASLEPVRLCNAVLTSEEGMESAFPDSTESFFEEPTPATEAFYFPAADIKDEPFVREVRLRYNYVALFNRVIHSYEWFQRMSTEVDEEDESVTKEDTLEWIRSVRPALSQAFINNALPDEGAQALAAKLMRAYDRFDGDDSEDSPFSRAIAAYTGALEEVSEQEIDRFEERFWDWYDKTASVPEIDTLIRMNMNDYEGEAPSEEQLKSMKLAIEAETDIDRRTILALEFVKFDPWSGVLLLGEILESRIYTKYLLEAWISWRANCQMNHGPSSFSVIANNYYDKVRVICLDTMLRHSLLEEDKNAEMLIENLLFSEIIHRMGGIYGNSSLATLADLSYGGEFIHPRLLEENE